jgi:hypothetical protein
MLRFYIPSAHCIFVLSIYCVTVPSLTWILLFFWDVIYVSYGMLACFTVATVYFLGSWSLGLVIYVAVLYLTMGVQLFWDDLVGMLSVSVIDLLHFRYGLLHWKMISGSLLLYKQKLSQDDSWIVILHGMVISSWNVYLTMLDNHVAVELKRQTTWKYTRNV